MTDKIRVGIVGATVTQGGSGWGAYAHVPALKALPHYELTAVCTAHEETAKASAERALVIIHAFEARRERRSFRERIGRAELHRPDIAPRDHRPHRCPR